MIKYKKIGKDLYELLEDYSEGGVKIAKGFVYDGASIPWYFRWLIKKSEKTKEASLVHDYIYQGGSKLRKEADELFYKLLLEDGVNPLKAWAMKKAVRVFGWMFYKG